MAERSGDFGAQQQREWVTRLPGGLGCTHVATSHPQVASLCSSSISGSSFPCHTNCACVFLYYMSYIHWILIIHRFCICKFTYLLKFICNSQVSTCSISWSFIFMDILRVAKNLSPRCTGSSLRSNRDAGRPSCFNLIL